MRRPSDQRLHRRITRSLALVLLASLASARQDDCLPLLSTDAEGGEVRLTLSLAGVHGEVGFTVEWKRITVVWLHRSPAGEPRMSFQDYQVDYWPSEVASFGTDGMLVAGKDRRTGTVLIERWELDPTESLPSPSVSPEAGELVGATLSVPVKKRTLVYKDDGARGNIHLLMKRQGTDTCAFVQFKTQRDLYSLDTSTGALTKVLSVQPDGLVPVVPALAELKGGRWSRKHRTQGYVYYLGEHGEPALGFYLFDRNLDGELDEHGLLTIEQHWERRLHQALDYDACY